MSSTDLILKAGGVGGGGMADDGFQAPGPGSWELETAHFERPVTRFFATALVAGLPRGFAGGTARYGAPLDFVRPTVVNGFVYSQPVMFGADGVTPEDMRARVAT